MIELLVWSWHSNARARASQDMPPVCAATLSTQHVQFLQMGKVLKNGPLAKCDNICLYFLIDVFALGTLSPDP